VFGWVRMEFGFHRTVFGFDRTELVFDRTEFGWFCYIRTEFGCYDII
jgi:hypothetical protein